MKYNLTLEGLRRKERLKKNSQRKTWAIDTNSKEGHGLLGIYAFAWNQSIPDCCKGYRIATFETRSIARSALKNMKCKDYIAFPKAKIVRLIISTKTKRA
jgi:hypothetical protein